MLKFVFGSRLGSFGFLIKIQTSSVSYHLHSAKEMYSNTIIILSYHHLPDVYVQCLCMKFNSANVLINC